MAFVLALVFPGWGPGFFAFTYEFGPVQKTNESERQYHLRMARYWFLGSLVFPATIALAYVFEKKYQEVVIAGVFAGFLIGVSCFLKGIGSLYHAGRQKH